MVLFKDLNEDATNILTKDFPHEKPYEFEYKNKNKNISFTNNALYNIITGGLDTSTTIKYLNCNNVSTEFKINGGGKSSFDIKYTVPWNENKYNKWDPRNFESTKFVDLNGREREASANYLNAIHSAFRGFTIGTKVEHKPKHKGKLSESTSFDVSCEYDDKKYVHTKLNINPVTTASTLSACLENRFKCGIFRIGAEVNAGDVIDLSKANYSLGCSFTKDVKNKILVSGGGGGRSDYILFPSYILSCKTAPYMNSQIGKVIVSLHTKTYINECMTQLAIQAEHSLNDKYTSFLFGGQFYVNKNKNTFIKVKCTHDLENICLSLFHKFNENLSANVGCRFDPTKMLDANAFRYGAKINLST